MNIGGWYKDENGNDIYQPGEAAGIFGVTGDLLNLDQYHRQFMKRVIIPYMGLLEEVKACADQQKEIDIVYKIGRHKHLVGINRREDGSLLFYTFDVKRTDVDAFIEVLEADEEPDTELEILEYNEIEGSDIWGTSLTLPRWRRWKVNRMIAEETAPQGDADLETILRELDVWE